MRQMVFNRHDVSAQQQWIRHLEEMGYKVTVSHRAGTVVIHWRTR